MTRTDHERTTELLRVLNSTPVVDGEQHDLLDGAGESDERVREARAILQAVVRGAQPTTALQPLLDGAVQRPTATSVGVVWETVVDDARAAAVDLVLTWDRVERTMPGRLRPCANEACTLFLLDRSRSGAGRWCSMAACGNRAKARRHYERHRHENAPTKKL